MGELMYGQRNWHHSRLPEAVVRDIVVGLNAGHSYKRIAQKVAVDHGVPYATVYQRTSYEKRRLNRLRGVSYDDTFSRRTEPNLFKKIPDQPKMRFDPEAHRESRHYKGNFEL